MKKHIERDFMHKDAPKVVFDSKFMQIAEQNAPGISKMIERFYGPELLRALDAKAVDAED